MNWKLTERLKANPEILVYLVFFISAGWLALKLRYGVAPDENFHFNSIKYYADHGLLSFHLNQNSDYNLGAMKTEVSFLYHYLMSFPYRLADLLNLNTLTFLRFINVLLGVATLASLNYLAKMLKLNKIVRLCALLFISTLPMFLLLASAVNYDNLAILLSVLAPILLIKFINNKEPEQLFYLLVLMILGPMVKFSFLPVSLVLFAFSGFVVLKNIGKFRASLSSLIRKHRPKAAVYGIALLLSLALFSVKYGGNIISYHRLEPKCDVVLTQQQCLNEDIYRREYEISQRHISPPGLNKDLYTVQWLKIMSMRTFGLHAHEDFKNIGTVISFGLLLFYALFIAFIRGIKLSRRLDYWAIPALFAAYTVALLLTNIATFKETGHVDSSVQGRYWLPVLLPFFLYVVSLHNGSLKKNNKLTVALCVVLVAFACVQGLPNIIHGINPNWY